MEVNETTDNNKKNIFVRRCFGSIKTTPQRGKSKENGKGQNLNRSQFVKVFPGDLSMKKSGDWLESKKSPALPRRKDQALA
jgi:hypothetical protein